MKLNNLATNLALTASLAVAPLSCDRQSTAQRVSAERERQHQKIDTILKVNVQRILLSQSDIEKMGSNRYSRDVIVSAFIQNNPQLEVVRISDFTPCSPRERQQGVYMYIDLEVQEKKADMKVNK